MNTIHLIATASAASVVVLFDLIWCFKEEWHHIWRPPFTFIKATYVFARYFPILIHSTNIGLFAHFDPPFPVELCQKWFLFQHLSTISVQVPFNSVVALRVFALYGYSAKIGVLVIAMVITDTTVALLAGTSIHHQANFGPICSTEGGKFSLVVPFIFQSFQGIMWGLTWYKQQSIKKKLHPSLYTNVSFLPTVVRDGSVVVAVLTLCFALSIPYSTLVRFETHMFYPWGTTLMSVFCCHLILNIRAKVTPDMDTEKVELDDLNTVTSPEGTPPTEQSDFASKRPKLLRQQGVYTTTHQHQGVRLNETI